MDRKSASRTLAPTKRLRAWASVGALFVAVHLAGCRSDTARACERHGECQSDDQKGFCSSGGFCRRECEVDNDCPCGSICNQTCGVCLLVDLSARTVRPATCYASRLEQLDLLGACPWGRDLLASDAGTAMRATDAAIDGGDAGANDEVWARFAARVSNRPPVCEPSAVAQMCTNPNSTSPLGIGPDAGDASAEAATDAGTLDAGTLDAGTLDAGTTDAGTTDATTTEGGG